MDTKQKAGAPAKREPVRGSETEAAKLAAAEAASKAAPKVPGAAPEAPAAAAAGQAAARPLIPAAAAADPAVSRRVLPASGELDAASAIDAGIADAVAGRRPLPTPETEAAAAIAEAPVDPRPGSGSRDDRPFETRFNGLTETEISALNVHVAALAPHDLVAFRAFLAKAPIDPHKGQGTLDPGAPGSLAEAAVMLAPEARALRPMPPGAAAQALGEQVVLEEQLDPERGPWLSIQAIRDGHRRAGRAWSTAPAFVSSQDLTEEQISLLRGDPAILIRKL